MVLRYGSSGYPPHIDRNVEEFGKLLQFIGGIGPVDAVPSNYYRPLSVEEQTNRPLHGGRVAL